MLFIQKFLTDPQTYVMWVLIVIFSVCCHEASHALVAKWQGDTTAADNGYLTLNPLKQMGLWSIFALIIVGLAWGAVPVNPNRMRNKYSHALVAFAGPFMNLILFFAFVLGASITFVFSGGVGLGENRVFQLFMTGGILNIVLLLFNLIPVPPLDGWTILSYIFPGVHRINPEVRNGIIFGLFIIIIFAIDKLFIVGYYCSIIALKFIVPLIGKVF